MSTFGKDPIPGRRGPVARWNYATLPLGGKIGGFKAGDPVGVYVHYLNRKSLPCRFLMSEGKLFCPLCSTDPAKWRGFTPFYGPEYQRQFILITEDFQEAFREIEVFEQIVFVRGKNPICPAVPKREKWRTSPIPESADRPREIDLAPFLLLVLWKDAELAKIALAGDIPLSVPPRCDPPEDPKAVQKWNTQAAAETLRKRLREAEENETAGRGMVPLGEVLKEKPKPNGKKRH